MSSWCTIASPLHGKVCRVFNGVGVLLMLHVHVAPLILLWHALCVRPFAKKSPCIHYPFVKISPRIHCPFMKNILTCIVYSQRKSPRMHCRSSVHEQIPLCVLYLFISFVFVSCLFVYLCLQSLMTRQHQIHKPPSIP